MKYSTGGKISPKGDTLEYLEGINSNLNDIEKKRNIKLRLDLDVAHQKEAEDLLEQFDEKSQNGLNNYYTSQDKALRILTEDFEDLESARKEAEYNGTRNSDQFLRTYETQSNAIVRETNAYIALCGSLEMAKAKISDFAKAQEKAGKGSYQDIVQKYDKIFQFSEAQEKTLMKNSSGSYQYTVKNFTDLFNVMRQLETYLDDFSGFSRNYHPFSVKMEDIESLTNRAQQAEKYLEETYKKHGTDKLEQGTRNEILKNMGILDKYYYMKMRLTKSNVPFSEAYKNARTMDIPHAFKGTEAFRLGSENITGAYDKIREGIRKEAMKGVEEAQRNLIGGYASLREQINQSIDEMAESIDNSKHQIAYGQIEQARQLASQWKSFESTYPQFSKDGSKGGAYTTNTAFTNASLLYESLLSQIEQGAISADEAITQMAQHLFEAVSRGEATPFFTDFTTSLQDEVDRLKATIKELEDSLRDMEADRNFWRDNYSSGSSGGYGGYGSGSEDSSVNINFGEIADVLRDLNTSLDKFNIDELVRAFSIETITSTLSNIALSVRNLENFFNSSKANITVNTGMQVALDSGEDPALVARYESLKDAIDNFTSPVKVKRKARGYDPVKEAERILNELKEQRDTALRILESGQVNDNIFGVAGTMNKGVGRVYTTTELKNGQTGEVAFKETKEAGGEGKFVDDGINRRQKEIDVLNEQIKAQEESIRLLKESNQQRKAITLSDTEIHSYDKLLLTILSNITEVDAQYNGDINKFKEEYGADVIANSPVSQRIKLTTQLAKWIKQLSKMDLGDSLNKAVKNVTKALPDLTTQAERTRLPIADTIDNILLTLQRISGQLQDMMDSLGGNAVSYVPNLSSNYLTERGQNLKQLYNRIGLSGNKTFARGKANEENIKAFLEQFHTYGNGEWSLDEFARINNISKKNLEILKKYNEELYKQEETVEEIAETQEKIAQAQGELPYMLDSHGNPMKWYRGLYGDSDLGAFSSHRFDGGTFWTNNPMVAASYGERTFPNRVYESLQSSYNPFVIDAKGGNWHNLPFFGLDDNAKQLQDDYEQVFDNLLQMGFNFQEAHQLLFEICGKWETIYPILTRKVQGKIKNLQGTLKKAGIEDWSDELLQRFDEIAESGYSYDHLFEEINEKLLEHGLVNLLDAEHLNVDTKTIVEEVLKHGGYDSVYFKNIVDKGGGGVIRDPKYKGRAPSKETIAEFKKDFMSDIIVQLNPDHTKYLSSGPSSQYLDETFVKHLIKVLREEFDVAEQEYDAFDTDNIEESFNLFKEELSNDDRVERFSVLKYFMELPEEVSQKIFNILTSDTLNTAQYSEPLALALAEELEELMKESVGDAFDDAYDLLRDLDTTGILDDKEKNKLIKEQLKEIQERYGENDEYLGKIYIQGLANDFAEGVVSKEAIGMNLGKGYDVVDKIVNELIANVWKEFDKQQKQAELPGTPEISETQTKDSLDKIEKEKEALEENNATIEEKKEITKEAGEVASQAIDNEIEKTAQLQTAVEGVTKAIQEETSALKEEAKVAEATATTEQETAKKTEEVKEKAKKKRGRPKKQLSEAEIQAQEETKSYVNEITKKRQALMMQRATENLLYNPNLNGQPREEMEGLLKLLKDVEVTTGMTKEEWANIQLIATDITNKAKSNINENKERIRQEKEKEKAAKAQLQAEKEKAKLLKSEADLEGGSKSKGKLTQAQALDTSAMATNVETATNALTGIKEDVKEIKEDVGLIRQAQVEVQEIYPKGVSDVDGKPIATAKIIPVKKPYNALQPSASELKEANESSNELARAIKGWVEASRMMSQVQEKSFEHQNLDRERAAFGDITNGKITNAYIVGDKDRVPSKLLQLMDEVIDKRKYSLDIHSHPDDFVAPSGWSGDLGAYAQEKTKQALIVGRKQSMLINTGMLSRDELKQLSDEYKFLVENYKDDADKVEQVQEGFYDKFQSLGDQKNGKSFQDFVYDRLRQYINDVLVSYAPDRFKTNHISEELFKDRIERNGFDFNIGSQQSLRVALMQLLPTLFTDFDKQSLNMDRLYEVVSEQVASHESERIVNGLDMYKIKAKRSFSEEESFIKLQQMAFADAFQTLFKDKSFDDFVKYLNYENPESLTTAAINNFLGIKNSDQTYLEDIADGIRQIISILNSGKVTLGEFQGTKQDTNFGERQSSNAQGTWYDDWHKINQQDKTRYSHRLEKAFATFKKSNPQGEMSDLEYAQKFYNEYLDYLTDDLEQAEKDDKQKKQKYKKYVEQQKKLEYARIEDIQYGKDMTVSEYAYQQAREYEEREKYYNEEKARLQQEEQDRQDLEALMYANQQANEYEAQESYYETEKARLKQEEQDKQDLEALMYANQQANEYEAQERYYKNEKARLQQEEQDKQDLEALMYANQQADEYAAQQRYYESERARMQQEEQDRLAYEALLYAQAQGEEYDAQQKYYEAEKARLQKEEQDKRDLDALIYANQQASEYSAQEKYYETEKARLQKEEQDRQDLEALLYAINQADEYKAQEEYYEKEKARLKQEEQDKQDIETLLYAVNQANEYEANQTRINQIGKMVKELEKITGNADLVGKARYHAEDLLNILKHIHQYGKIDVQDLQVAEQEFAQIKSEAQQTVDEQKEMNRFAEQLGKIQGETVYGRQKYMPGYLSEVERAMDIIKQHRNTGTGLSNAEFQAIVQTVNASANPSGAILTGDKTFLQRNIVKAEKMLATNYMPGNLQAELRQVVEQMRNLEQQGLVSAEAIDNITTAFRHLEMEAAKAGKTFLGQIGQRLKDMNAKFIATYFSLHDLVRYMRTMISTITELDTALTEMRKVSDESLKTLKEYQKTTFDTAGALGTTAVQLQQSTADWLRLGESLDEASKSAVAATTLFNVSEFENINDATTALVAMSQAYKDLDKTEIIDVLNNIGNNYAIATDQLATALQASSSALVTQGNDLYEAAALVTAGNQVLQDASKTGTGIRTISLRIAGMKMGKEELEEELNELGEEVDDWVVQTESKKREAIMNYTRVASNGGQGVDILDSNGNLKDTYHIMLEISKVYKEIQEEDKKYGTNRAQALVEELAGKVRSNVAASILLNPEILEDVYNSAIDSAGSAAEENAKYLDSIVGKTQQFKNELQELEQNVLDSSLIKDTIDLGTALLSIFNGLGDALPVVISLLGAAALGVANLNKEAVKFVTFTNNEKTGGLAGKGLFRALATSMGIGTDNKYLGVMFGDALRQNMQSIFANQDFADFSKQFADAIPTAEIDKFVAQHGNLNDAINTSSKILLSKGVKSMQEYDNAALEAGEQIQATQAQVKAFNAVMASVSAIAATVAVSLIVAGLRKIVKYTDELEQKAKEASDTVKEITNELRDNDKYIKEVSDDFVRLGKGVDSLGHNMSLSNEEFAQYNSIANEIAERMPSMVSGWNEEGNAIINTKNDVEALTEAYRQYRLERLADMADTKNVQATADALNNYIAPVWHQSIWNTFKQIPNLFTKTGLRDLTTDTQFLNGIGKLFGLGENVGVPFWEGIANTDYASFSQQLQNPLDALFYSGYTSDSFADILKSYAKYVAAINSQAYKNGEDVVIDLGKYFTYTINQDQENAYISKENYAQLQKEATMVAMNEQRKLQEYIDSYKGSVKAVLDFNIELNKVDISDETQALARNIIDNLDNDFAIQLSQDEVLMNTFTNELANTLANVNEEDLSALLDDKSLDKNYRETVREFEEAYSRINTKVIKDLQNANATPEEIERAQQMMDALRKASGLEDYEKLDDEFNRNTLQIAANTKDKEALKELNELTKDFSANNMQLWLDNVDATMTATQAVEAYKAALEKLPQDTRYGSIGALLSQGSTIGSSKTTWAEVRDELVGIAQEGKLDEEYLKNYRYLDEIFKELGIDTEKEDDALKDFVSSINKMALNNAIDQLDQYKQGIDHLDTAYQQYKSGKLIDATMLNDIQSTMGSLDSWTEFEKAVMTGTKDLQSYFDAMVNEYAKQHTALADLNEDNKDWVEQQLVASGITKKSAHETIENILKEKRALEEKVRAGIVSMNTDIQADKALKQYTVATEDLNLVTAEQIAQLIKAKEGIDAETSSLELEEVKLDEAAQAVVYFTLKKELAEDITLKNEEDLEYLFQLIKLAGLAGESIVRMKKLIANYDIYTAKLEEATQARDAFLESNKLNLNNTAVQTHLGTLNAEVEKYKDIIGEVDGFTDDLIAEMNDKYSQFDYHSQLGLAYGGAVDSSKQAAEDALAKAKETLDKILAMYDAELDAGVISFQTYVDKSKAIIEQYYRDGKLKAQDYYDELASLYEKQVQQYDKVISAVQKKLSEETDALEKQKENIEKSYNEQIEVIQKKIDALQEENDEIDRNMALSKAQYELARAQNQRTRLMYSESRGFYYEADLKGISEAEENVRKAKTDKMVSEYEKQIKSLQDAMESETKSIDEQIKKLNEYSEAWGKVSSKLEDAQNALRATEVLGPDWETNIKSGLETLNDFTEKYVKAQEAQKQAYLDARIAEANNPVGGGSGGTSAPSGGGTSGNNGNYGGSGGNNGSDLKSHSQGNVDNSGIQPGTLGQKREEEADYKYKFNGTKYKTKSAADQARMDYIDAMGQKAYDEALKAPISNLSQREYNAQQAKKNAEAEARKKKVEALFSGTDSAKAGTTLVGELKPEIVLDKKSGTATFVDSPTLMNMKGGEKVFNGDETEKILKSKYVPMKQFNPKKFAMLHAFAGGTSSPMQTAIAAQAVGIASGLKSGLLATSHTGGQTINQTFNVSLPNITDASKANDLFREFEQLSRKATQYFN